MLTVRYHKKFKKDFKLAVKRGYNIRLLEEIVEKLVNQEPLPIKNRDHSLSGNYEGFRECHIQPDWLLIYKIEDEELILTLTRTGTHSDLF